MAETLLRTATLIALTIGLMALCRFWAPARGLVIWVAGTGWWQSMYGWLHLDNGLQREQSLLIGIAVASFFLALLIQGGGLLLLRRIRSARARR